MYLGADLPRTQQKTLDANSLDREDGAYSKGLMW